jgi:hypothetical protein
MQFRIETEQEVDGRWSRDSRGTGGTGIWIFGTRGYFQGYRERLAGTGCLRHGARDAARTRDTMLRLIHSDKPRIQGTHGQSYLVSYFLRCKMKTCYRAQTGYVLREAGTLVIVFAPLYWLFEPSRPHWGIVLLLIVLGIGLLVVGIEIERGRA